MVKRKQSRRPCAENGPASKKPRMTPDVPAPALRRSSRLPTALSADCLVESKTQLLLPSPTLSNPFVGFNGAETRVEQACTEVQDTKKDGLVDDIGKVAEETAYNPVAHWAEHHSWPSDFASKGFGMDEASSSNPQKRQRSGSYSQAVKDGKAPEQYTPAYERMIAEVGLNMDVLEGEALVSTGSKATCKDLEKINHTQIRPTLVPHDKTRQLLNSLRGWNEAIVQRDVTPLILPPVAALRYDGAKDLDHIADEVTANWAAQCILAGPRLRPDLTIGLAPSAFTPVELDKLKVYSSVDNWAKFTEQLYFPFLTCEVKCGDGGLNRADRQNMHSNSVAVRAILRLVQEADRHRGTKQLGTLDKQVLTFSFSHDETEVRVYGHFAVLDQEKWSYHRYLLKKVDMIADPDGLLIAYNIAQNVLREISPLHVARIKEALEHIPEPTTQSLAESTTNLDIEAQQNSQNEAVFLKPAKSASAMMSETIKTLQDQMEKLQDLLEKEKEGARQREEEARKREEEARKREEEARKREEEARKREEEARKREEKMQQQIQHEREQEREQWRQQMQQQVEQHREFVSLLRRSET